MNLKRNGNDGGGLPPNALKIGLLVLVLLLVGLLSYRLLERQAGPLKTVWVPRSSLAQGAVVTSEDFEPVRVRERKVPEDAVTDLTRIVGRALARVKPAGEPFVAADFATPGRGPGRVSIAKEVPEGRVLTTLRVDTLAIPYPQLDRGDRLEVIAAGGSGSGTVARDAFFLGWINPAAARGNGKARESGTASLLSRVLRPPPARGGSAGGAAVTLLLALNPGDVISVAQAQASRARISLVLHGRSDVMAGKMLKLQRAEEVELITGGRRERVAL